MAKKTILVTGGSGFLGQHLIKELQETWPDRVDCIKVADRSPFRKLIDWPDNIVMKHYAVDCADEASFDEVFRDGDAPICAVFNLAGRREIFDVHQDILANTRDNVSTVSTLITLMIRHGVEWLVHCSDAYAAVGQLDAQGITEVSTSRKDQIGKWFYSNYGETKFEGEQLAIAANGALLDIKKGQNEEKSSIKTIVIRPSDLYGEGDTGLMAYTFKLCHQYGYILKTDSDILGGSPACFQLSYVGNAASFLLHALQCLQADPQTVGGEVFFYTDGPATIMNYYDYIKPFVYGAGYQFSNRSWSYLFVAPAAYLYEKFFRWTAAYLGCRLETTLPSFALVQQVCGWYMHFNVSKTRLLLDFKDRKYDSSEAMRKSVAWWVRRERKGEDWSKLII